MWLPKCHDIGWKPVYQGMENPPVAISLKNGSPSCSNSQLPMAPPQESSSDSGWLALCRCSVSAPLVLLPHSFCLTIWDIPWALVMGLIGMNDLRLSAPSYPSTLAVTHLSADCWHYKKELICPRLSESSPSLPVPGTADVFYLCTCLCPCVLVSTEVTIGLWIQGLQIGRQVFLTTESSFWNYIFMLMCWIISYKISVYLVSISNRTEQK